MILSGAGGGGGDVQRMLSKEKDVWIGICRMGRTLDGGDSGVEKGERLKL